METEQAKTLLANHRERRAIFISDPDHGDRIYITDGVVFVKTASEIGTAGEFLDRLDFETYEGEGPIVVIL